MPRGKKSHDDDKVDANFISDLEKFVEKHPLRPSSLIDDEQYRANPIAVLGSALMKIGFEQMQAAEPPLSKKEAQVLSDRIAADRNHWEEQDAERRRVQQLLRFEIAEKWGAKPGLSSTDRCHGVVWDLYNVEAREFSERYPDHQLSHVPSAEYAKLYDAEKAEDIRTGLASAAIVLFS